MTGGHRGAAGATTGDGGARRPAILIPAAGASSRMAPRDKLLEPVDGVPLLRERALAALSTGARVVVTLPPDRPERRAAVADLGLHVVIVPQAAEGMATSIAAGVAALDGEGVTILPGDMPDIAAAHLRALLDAAEAEPRAIHRGAADGVPGHPVVFPGDLLGRLAALRGDEGARAVLRDHADRVRLHDLPGRAALTDLDTPEAWEAWRARTGR